MKFFEAACGMVVIVGIMVLYLLLSSADRSKDVEVCMPQTVCQSTCRVCTVMVVQVPTPNDYWKWVIDSLKMEIYATQSEIRCHEENTGTNQMFEERFNGSRIEYWFRNTPHGQGNPHL